MEKWNKIQEDALPVETENEELLQIPQELEVQQEKESREDKKVKTVDVKFPVDTMFGTRYKAGVRYTFTFAEFKRLEKTSFSYSVV